MSQGDRYGRVMTVEEYKALPPLTEEERAETHRIRTALMAGVRREHEAFVAAGGHVMTDEEWDAYWHEDDDVEEDWGPVSAK